MASCKTGQIVVLRFDDIVSTNSPFNYVHGEESEEFPGVPERWLKVSNYIEQNGLKGAFGIICESLEKDNKLYFTWLKELIKRGNIELWLHAYKDRLAEDEPEFEQQYQLQFNSLLKAVILAREKLDLSFTAFDPHWSGSNVDTEKALDQFPEIKIRLGIGPKSDKRLTFEHLWRLEFPTQNPDFDKFRIGYEKDYRNVQALCLFCGHPLNWDARSFREFVKAMEYLKSKCCVFMTPKEYMNSVTFK